MLKPPAEILCENRAPRKLYFWGKKNGKMKKHRFFQLLITILCAKPDSIFLYEKNKVFESTYFSLFTVTCAVFLFQTLNVI
jgi:hypothetical protein